MQNFRIQIQSNLDFYRLTVRHLGEVKTGLEHVNQIFLSDRVCHWLMLFFLSLFWWIDFKRCDVKAFFVCLFCFFQWPASILLVIRDLEIHCYLKFSISIISAWVDSCHPFLSGTYNTFSLNWPTFLFLDYVFSSTISTCLCNETGMNKTYFCKLIGLILKD